MAVVTQVRILVTASYEQHFFLNTCSIMESNLFDINKGTIFSSFFLYKHKQEGIHDEKCVSID